MVESKDILSALDTMGVYLPDYPTTQEKVEALVGALEVIQSQVKQAKDEAAQMELERQKREQLAQQIEDKSVRIRMKADELIQTNEKLLPVDAFIQAAQIVKEQDATLQVTKKVR